MAPANAESPVLARQFYAHPHREGCGEADVARLREVGFTDEDILHIVEVTAIFYYNVRLATATGLFPNLEYHQVGRSWSTDGRPADDEPHPPAAFEAPRGGART